MNYDLQKAGMWKRIAAWILDGILVCVLAVGAACLLSWILGYDGYSQTLEAAYAQYESAFGVKFNVSQAEYLAFTEAELQNYQAAYDALIADTDAMYAYNMVVNLSVVVTSLGILLAVMILEFVVPLFLGNGQTVGKKVFSLCLVRVDGVRVNTMQLFARALLGKFTLETMIPVYICMMIFWGTMDVTGTVVLLILLAAEIVCLLVTRSRSMLHDLLAGTAVADLSSQMIFRSTEDLISYKKKIHAELAARKDY